jgi:hypothetical protein
MNTICTCTNTKCKLHPSNHNKGCTPCISKNLKLQEIQNCFFKLVTDDIEAIEDCSLKGFAKKVLGENCAE